MVRAQGQMDGVPEEGEGMNNKISAVMIALNEEKVIGRCIKSLTGFDEIVVLDTGSTDKTLEVARKHGAAVYMRQPQSPFHFAEARNEANALAQNDWVLSIDCDEVLRAGAIRKIRHAIEEHPEATSFKVTFIDQPAGGGTKVVSILKRKIYRKSAYTWKLRVHEELEPTQTQFPIDLPIVAMEHLPVADKSKRHGQNIELLKLCVKENPEHARAFKHLGQELMLRKDWREAIPYLAEYVEKTDEEPIERSAVLCNIGKCYGDLGELEDALKFYDLGAKMDPRRREPLYQAAFQIFSSKTITVGDLVKAKEFLERLLAIPPAQRPNSHLDYPAAWGNEPTKMLRICETELRKAGVSA